MTTKQKKQQTTQTSKLRVEFKYWQYDMHIDLFKQMKSQRTDHTNLRKGSERMCAKTG